MATRCKYSWPFVTLKDIIYHTIEFVLAAILVVIWETSKKKRRRKIAFYIKKLRVSLISWKILQKLLYTDVLVVVNRTDLSFAIFSSCLLFFGEKLHTLYIDRLRDHVYTSFLYIDKRGRTYIYRTFRENQATWISSLLVIVQKSCLTWLQLIESNGRTILFITFQRLLQGYRGSFMQETCIFSHSSSLKKYLQTYVYDVTFV